MKSRFNAAIVLSAVAISRAAEAVLIKVTNRPEFCETLCVLFGSLQIRKYLRRGAICLELLYKVSR